MLFPALMVVVGAGVGVQPGQDLPLVEVTRDNTVIESSCRLLIAERTVIPDADGNGVVQVKGDNIAIEFIPDARLAGAAEGTPGDQLAGVGLWVQGGKNITIRGAQVSGYKVGVRATGVTGLTIDTAHLSGNFRQRLKSTPTAEDASDWLWPHRNDRGEWAQNYGAGLCIEDATGVVVRGVYVRHGQNGIILDRVTDSAVYDNNCSFLSGWGLAMWRSSRNLVSRNSFDFCVRGHVEGVYNRGQDSAGILVFEQCNGNTFVENSATHGGDGFFCFAGREAIGEVWLERERERLKKETGKENVEDLIVVPPELAQKMGALGCNDNLLLRNDFSYAAAHGVEITFSERNRLIGNTIAGNAICGLWGGYSSGMVIADNTFTGNGGMAYGLERGGINMEHASDNLITANTFTDNRCAIHLWWNDNPGLRTLPGVMGQKTDVTGNRIIGNTFTFERPEQYFRDISPAKKLVILQLRDSGTGHVRENEYADNTVQKPELLVQEFDVKPGTEPRTIASGPAFFDVPQALALGARSPTTRAGGGGRGGIGGFGPTDGRDAIVMTEWGPWDGHSPLVRRLRAEGSAHVYEVMNVDQPMVTLSDSPKVAATVEESLNGRAQGTVRIAAEEPGVFAYRAIVSSGHRFGPRGAVNITISGTIVNTAWDATFFAWRSAEPGKPEPPPNLDAWRALAADPGAVRASVGRLAFTYGAGGPSSAGISPEVTAAKFKPDFFGMIATTTIPLTKGKWRLSTLSDDGVRVMADGKTVLENWTHHGPTRDSAVIDITEDRPVRLVVEHFEIYGYAVLEFEIAPEETPP